MLPARPMVRPSKPPFALIAAVVLFVIASGFAVGMYMQKTKAELAKSAADAELETAQQQIRTLKQTHSLLSDKISGSSSLAADLAAAEAVIANINATLADMKVDILDASAGETRLLGGRPAREAIITLATNRKAAHDLYLKADADYKTANDKANKANEELNRLQEQLAQIKKDDADARTGLLQRHDQELAKSKREIDAARAEATEKEAKLQSSTIALNEARKDWEMQRQRYETEIAKLDREIKKLTGSRVNPTEYVYGPMKLPDGTVSQMVPEQNQVFLRLTRPDQARLGMRYIIFSKNKPIPENGEGKAVVEISGVDGQTVKAKIEKVSNASDPIVTGDLALNLVVGPRKLNFVVFGDFDLNGDTVNDSNSRQQIESLITRWGGTVQKDFDISTNFVVLGDQPMPPSVRPGEGADPQVLADYERKVADNARWVSLKDQAAKFSIPVLSTTTFLHWVGYFNDDLAPGWEKRVRPGENYFPQG